MTWAYYTSTAGSATLGYRLAIYGFPFGAVTSQEMTSDSTTPPRIVGLNLQGAKFDARVDLGSWKLTAGGITVKLADAGTISPNQSSIANPWTLYFGKRPTATTWLTVDLTNATATVTVDSTSGFASSGTIWIDQEAITYSGVTGTTFTGCTRGALGTIAAYHYITDGSRKRSPEVTNWPVMLEGMRAAIFAYGEDDTATGNGTQVWLGVVRSEPRWDGKFWSIGLDNIISTLDATIGGDLAAPVRPRGILYPGGVLSDGSLGYVNFTLGENSDANPYSAPGTSATVQLALAGAFYETQQDFVAALNTAITAATGGFSGTFAAVSDGDAGWHIEYVTGVTPKYPTIHHRWPRVSVIDPPFEAALCTSSVGTPDYGPLTATKRYYFFPAAAPDTAPPGLGSVPRGVCDKWSTVVRIDSPEAIPAATAYAFSAEDAAAFGAEYNGEDYNGYISTTDSTNRTLTMHTDRWFSWTRPKTPDFKLGRNVDLNWPQPGAVGDLLTTLQGDASQYSALGAVPLISTADGSMPTYTPAMGPLAARMYSFWSPVSLLELITEELKLLGYIPALDSTGKYTAVRLRFASASELPAAVVALSDPLVDKQLASYDRAAFGVYNTLVYQEGYDPTTEKRNGMIYRARDVASFGRSCSTRAISIKPLSRGPSHITVDDVETMAARLLGVLGQPYAIATIEAPMTKFSALIGDVVSVTDAHIPETDGTLGCTSRMGIVIGREWEPYSPRMVFTVLLTEMKIGGYAPAAIIDSNALVSGNTYNLTCQVALHPTVAPSNASWFVVGDRVQVVRYNNATATRLAGTVAATASTVVRVTFDGAWTPSTDSWYLTIADVDDASLVTRQKNFVHVASSAGQLAYSSGTVAGYEFGP